MISDVLSDASAEINRYMTEMPDAYNPGEPLTERIVAMATEMDRIRTILDTSPDQRDE